MTRKRQLLPVAWIPIYWVATCWIAIGWVATAFGQLPFPPNDALQFELTAPGLTNPSRASVSPQSLEIQDADGNISQYVRLGRYDTSDGKLLGYSSKELRQVIRWPFDNRGRMQIGTLQKGKIVFVWSKMQIEPSMAMDVETPQEEILPPAMAMHLAVGNESTRQFLTMQRGDRFDFTVNAIGQESAWYITPVSNNIVRLQQRQGNNWLAIGIQNGSRRTNRGYPISVFPIQNGVEQLWRIQNQGAGGYCFESLMYPGLGLTCVPNFGLGLQPITYDPFQIWWASAPTFVLPQPQFRSVQQRIESNGPLPPADIDIVNTHNETLIILLADRRNISNLQKMRIEVGKSERIQVERDSGATLFETFETMDGFGNWQQQQFQTSIPSPVLYDISVYEEFLQSIAIDRTGTSPNPIEDVNYQPRSIGFFLLPAGAELPAESELDAYTMAINAQNPGGVRRFSQREQTLDSNPPNSDPLKDLLKQFQKRRGSF